METECRLSSVLKVDSYDLLAAMQNSSFRLFKLRKDIPMSFSSETNDSQEIQLCILGFLDTVGKFPEKLTQLDNKCTIFT